MAGFLSKLAPKVSVFAPRLGAGLSLLSSIKGGTAATADTKFVRSDSDAFKTPGQRKQETTTLIAWIAGGVAVVALILFLVFKRK